jgi:hypothetical protein
LTHFLAKLRTLTSTIVSQDLQAILTLQASLIVNLFGLCLI